MVEQYDGKWEHDHGFPIWSCENFTWWVESKLARIRSEICVLTLITDGVDNWCRALSACLDQNPTMELGSGLSDNNRV